MDTLFDWLVSELLYADDQTLLAENIADAQRMLEVFQKVFAKWGLKFSSTKTFAAG